jgi:hypothetical protein
MIPVARSGCQSHDTPAGGRIIVRIRQLWDEGDVCAETSPSNVPSQVRSVVARGPARRGSPPASARRRTAS